MLFQKIYAILFLYISFRMKWTLFGNYVDELNA